MKTRSLITFLCLCVNFLFAQEGMIINGSVKDDFYSKVVLYEVINGRVEPLAESKAVGGKFAFKFYPSYEGFYALGRAESKHSAYYHIIYGKNKEVLNISIAENGYTLTGKNSRENIDLSEYQKLLNPLKEGTKLTNISSYKEFYLELERLAIRSADFKTTSKDLSFISNFYAFKPFLLNYYALHFQYLPKAKHPQKEEISAFYSKIDHQHFLTEDLLKMPFGENFLTTLIMDANLSKKYSVGKGENRNQKGIDFIENEIIKGQYLTQLVQNMKSYDEYQRLVSPNLAYVQLSDQKERLTKKLIEITDSKPGHEFLDFNFSDVHGKGYSKKSFLGKVLVLDFWATWCGPCKAEEPYFEKLAEEFQGKDVVFVAISTDKDKRAWENYVKLKDGNFKGLHLHAGNNNILSKAYEVNTIPRYMLIDKNGKIVSINSPRPSNPELKQMIEKYLSY